MTLTPNQIAARVTVSPDEHRMELARVKRLARLQLLRELKEKGYEIALTGEQERVEDGGGR